MTLLAPCHILSLDYHSIWRKSIPYTSSPFLRALIIFRLFNTIWLHSPLSSFLDFSIGFFTLHPLHSCPHFLLTNPYTLLSSICPPLTLISSISSSKYFFNVLNTCLSRTHTKHLLGNIAALQMYFSLP